MIKKIRVRCPCCESVFEIEVFLIHKIFFTEVRIERGEIIFNKLKESKK